jgi:hypothetical protein
LKKNGKNPRTDFKKEQRKKQLKSTAYVVFLFDFAGHRCRREEKEKTGQIRPFPAPAAAREPTRRQ